MKLPVLRRKELPTSPVSAFALAGFFVQEGNRGTEGATWQTT